MSTPLAQSRSSVYGMSSKYWTRQATPQQAVTCQEHRPTLLGPSCPAWPASCTTPVEIRYGDRPVFAPTSTGRTSWDWKPLNLHRPANLDTRRALKRQPLGARCPSG
ncbi:hypothetical protein SCARD494_03536 [Seiridium cardinale]